jgi:endonuclease-8
MPEGDTIFKAARSLDRILTGRRLVRLEVRPGRPGPARRVGGAGGAAERRPQPGELVTSVEARGKHLLITFEGGLTLHTHLQMHGGWHAYRPGERWTKPATAARAVLEVADAGAPDVVVAVAVCFSAPVVELLQAPAVHPRLAALGPDLCRPDADLAEAVARLGRLPATTEIGAALLDQRVASGVGNVYKSEVLFACGVDPFTPVGALGPEVRRRLLETAARLLQANLDSRGGRSTVGLALGDGGGRSGGPGRRGLAVYGRAGRPCRRCGTIIRRGQQGDGARATYWCPTCQPAPPEVSPSWRRR